MFFQDPLSYRLFFSFLFKPTSLWNSSFTWKLLLSKNNVRNFLFFLPFFWNGWFSEFSLPPLCLIYAKIEAMDKIIKTISESGAFRAYVLYEQPKKNITHKLAPRSHLAVPSLPVKSWRQTRKEILKLRSKSLELAHSEPSSPWQIPREMLKATCKILEWISKRLRLVKFWWDHLSETENSWLSQIMVREILITPWPLL